MGGSEDRPCRSDPLLPNTGEDQPEQWAAVPRNGKSAGGDAIPDQSGRLDWDALLTLALAILVLLLSAGLLLCCAMIWVLYVGLRTGSGPAEWDWLVVPGKRLVDGQPDGDFQTRLLAAGRLAKDQPASRILILGGRTGGASISEAKAGEQWLRRHWPEGGGLDIDLEQGSDSTLMNLRHTRRLLHAPNAPSGVTLVSNRYHLARLGLIAASLGLQSQLCAAEGRAAGLRGTSVQHWPLEAFFVCWFLTGKLWARLIRSRRMLDRVT